MTPNSFNLKLLACCNIISAHKFIQCVCNGVDASVFICWKVSGILHKVEPVEIEPIHKLASFFFFFFFFFGGGGGVC